MSTCRGAAPPHDDCPHGNACDWENRDASTKDQADLAAIRAEFARAVTLGKQPANRAERRAAERAARRSR